MFRRLLDISIPILIVGALVACKKSSTRSEGTTGSATPAASTQAEEAQSNAFISDFDLARVCNELPVKAAKAYDAAAGRIHPTIVFTRKNATEKFTKSYDSDLDGWKSEDAKGYELVACVTTKGSTKVKECKFDSKTPVRYLDLEDASYEMVVYEAQTAKQVGKNTVDLKVDKDCPMLWMFNSDHDVKQAESTPALMGWAKQYVAPKAGGGSEPEQPAAKTAKPDTAAEKKPATATTGTTPAAKSEPAKTPTKADPAKTPTKADPAKPATTKAPAAPKPAPEDVR